MSLSGRWLQAWKLYDIIPMKTKTYLPDEGFEARPIQLHSSGLTFPVYCLPAPKNGRSKHRVMVKCTCGRDIPFGRMGQHFPVHG